MEDLHEWGTRLEVLEDVKEKEIVFADILRVLQMPGGTDGAKSLAAQLVSKHAPTFPHHEDAAIDALINLSQGGDGKQSQSVRIHAILGLVTFVKGQTTISLPLHEKLGQFVHATLARETSGVLLRHLTSLQKLLTPAPTAPVASAPSSSLTNAAVPSSPAKPEPRRECIPPSPYLYIKGFQLGTELGKLLAYFQNVDPTLTLSKIHLNKASKHHHNAFLNCTTIDKARQVIEYASTHPFDNRNLVALFARGPQVASVVFHLASSYPTPPNDLAEVWPDVKLELQRLKATYWSTTVGKAKFDSMDFVKMLVTKGLTVRGQKIWIVYDMDEQAKAHDAHTKRPAAVPSRFAAPTASPLRTTTASPSTRHVSPHQEASTPPPSRFAALHTSPAKPMDSIANTTPLSPHAATNHTTSPVLRGAPPPSSPARLNAPTLPLPTGSPTKPAPSSPESQSSLRPPNDNHDGPQPAPSQSLSQSNKSVDANVASDSSGPSNHASGSDSRPSEPQRASNQERSSVLPKPTSESQPTAPSLGEIARAGGSDKYEATRGRTDSKGSSASNKVCDDKRAPSERLSREQAAPRPQPTIGELARAGGASLTTRRSHSRDGPRSRDRAPRFSPPSRPQPTIGDMARSGGGSLSERRSRSRDRPRTSSPPSRPQPTIGDMARSGGGSLSERRSRSRDRPRTSSPPSRSQSTIGDMARSGGGSLSEMRSRSRERTRPRPSSPYSRPQATIGDMARAGGGSLCSRSSVDDSSHLSRRNSNLDSRGSSRSSAPQSSHESTRAMGKYSPESRHPSNSSSHRLSSYSDRPGKDDRWNRDDRRDGDRRVPRGTVDDFRTTKSQQDNRPPARTLGEIARAGGGSLVNAPPPFVSRPRSRSRSRLPEKAARSRSRGRPEALPPSASSSRTPASPNDSMRGYAARDSKSNSRWVGDGPVHKNREKGSSRHGSRHTFDDDAVLSAKRKEPSNVDASDTRNQRPRHDDGEGGSGPAAFFSGRPQVDYSGAVYRSSRHAEDVDSDRGTTSQQREKQNVHKEDDARPSHENELSHRPDAAPHAATRAHQGTVSPQSMSTPGRPLVSRTVEVLQTDGRDHGSCTPDSDTGSLKLRDILNPARSSQFDLDDECEVDYDEE